MKRKGDATFEYTDHWFVGMGFELPDKWVAAVARDKVAIVMAQERDEVWKARDGAGGRIAIVINTSRASDGAGKEGYGCLVELMWVCYVLLEGRTAHLENIGFRQAAVKTQSWRLWNWDLLRGATLAPFGRQIRMLMSWMRISLQLLDDVMTVETTIAHHSTTKTPE